MGKHDKQEETVLRATVDEAEWLRERNHTLAKENTQLREQVKKLQDALGNVELCMEHGENISQGIINELKEEINDLNTEIEKLKKALVASALREVEA